MLTATDAASLARDFAVLREDAHRRRRGDEATRHARPLWLGLDDFERPPRRPRAVVGLLRALEREMA